MILCRYNNKEVSLEQVKVAAHDANALGFIESNQFGKSISFKTSELMLTRMC